MRISARKVVYLITILSVAVPLVTGLTLPAVRMPFADAFYEGVERVGAGPRKTALLAFDFGPNSRAENEGQAEVVFEHLMRRRVPTILFSLYPLAEGFLKTLPERVVTRLRKEDPSGIWKYGTDWVNLGYRPGLSLFIQGIAKADDLPSFFGRDSSGAPASSLPLMKGVRTLEDVGLVGEFTGLVGIFDPYVQFLRRRGYVPPLVHGCTSITIPEGYIYMDSGQLAGLLEGASGAAWYSERLRQAYPDREPDSAGAVNTALGVSQLTIILLVVAGNVATLYAKRRGKTDGPGRG